VLSQGKGLPRIACATPAEVMSEWRAVNEAAGQIMYLDLIITPNG
jgi:hypothetical protein